MSLRGLRSKPWQSASLCAGFLLKTLQRRTDCRVGLRPPRNEKSGGLSLYFAFTGKRGRLRALSAADTASKRRDGGQNSASDSEQGFLGAAAEGGTVSAVTEGLQAKSFAFSLKIRKYRIFTTPQSASLSAPLAQGSRSAVHKFWAPQQGTFVSATQIVEDAGPTRECRKRRA